MFTKDSIPFCGCAWHNGRIRLYQGVVLINLPEWEKYKTAPLENHFVGRQIQTFFQEEIGFFKPVIQMFFFPYAVCVKLLRPSRIPSILFSSSMNTSLINL